MRPSAEQLKAIPSAQAMSDYIGGGGFDDNPYQKDSADYLQYQSAMHRYFNEELRDLRQQLNGEPSCL
jgi:hypothetical protein